MTYFNNPMCPVEAHSLKVKRILFKAKPDYQEVLVFESSTFGKVLVQLPEKNECAYQEMTAHIPHCSIPSPKTVLVGGDGDGSVLEEICRHSWVEHIDICEIVFKKFSPELAVGFEEPHFRLHVSDAVEFLRHVPKGKYDPSIVDLSDTVGT